MKSIFKLPRPVFVLGIVSLLTDFSSEMIYPILPLFLANVVGASTVFIGLIEGIAESTASLLKIFSGWLSDKLQHRKFIIVGGYVISSLAKPFLAIATSGMHVLGIRFADRLGKGIRGAPRDAMIADVTERGERGKAFGFHRAMDTMGAILGPAAAFIILSFTSDGYRPLFLIAAIPALVAVAIIVFGVKEKRNIPEINNPPSPPFKKGGDAVSTPSFSKGGAGRILALPRSFIILLIIIGIFTLGNSSDAFLILRAQGLGVKTRHIPLLWLSFNVIYTLTALYAGGLSDRIGRKKIIITGFLVYSLCYLGFASAKESWHVWSLFSVYGIYYGMFEGVVRAHIADIVPAGVRATSYGIYNFVTGVLLLPASLLTGFVWKKWSPEIALGIGAMLAGISAISFAIYAKFSAHKE